MIKYPQFCGYFCYNDDGEIMSIVGTVLDNLNFNDTVFLKEDSDLQRKLEALTRLNQEYPNNSDIQEEMYIVKMGLLGEDEIK